jgi:hypothetical protein
MKGILIDVVNKTVTDVEYDGTKSLKEWYRLMNCNMVEVATDLPTTRPDRINSIMVDEEGMLSMDNNSRWFTFEGAHQPFVGNGLIVGLDDSTGETIDVFELTADDVRGKIKFLSMNEVRQLVM